MVDDQEKEPVVAGPTQDELDEIAVQELNVDRDLVPADEGVYTTVVDDFVDEAGYPIRHTNQRPDGDPGGQSLQGRPVG